MRNVLLAPLAFSLIAAADPPIPVHGPADWKATAARVTITRDDWGIAHVRGHTDADAVFGMIYAQAEDDFARIEANYLTSLGRTAEADGPKAVWQDLRARFYVSEPELKADYWKSPQAMRRLMDAWADGLNYYLATHPAVKPRVLKRFEPWMALSFTEGSIGGDIERIDLDKLAAFYGGKTIGGNIGPKVAMLNPDLEPRGSNGIAIAPGRTGDGHALLLINPHTSFYFRSEQQVTSDEGLDVYGAATWGQFFIYQGFNAHAGWMHTSSGVDNVDEFAYPVRRMGAGWQYRFGGKWQPIVARPIAIKVRQANGTLATRRFTGWMTRRGPVVRSEGGKWIAFAMMDRPVEALQQSFGRTKATDLDQFVAVSQLKANSSNNTVFADNKGEIAFLAPQFVPARDDRFDYTKAVDGDDVATDWGALLPVSRLPNVISPANGWIANSNDSPWSVAGPFSPDPKRFPPYLDTAGRNYRTVHYTRLLSQPGPWSLDRLQKAAYDRDQPAFETLVPMLQQAWARLPAGDPRRARFAAPVQAMANWDKRWSVSSVPNTLANYWGDELYKAVLARDSADHDNAFRHIERLSDAAKLDAFAAALDRIERDFGRWQVPWGEVNRYQRLSGAIDPPYSDSAPSLPVGFTSNRWGSLASFGARPRDGTKRWYGDNGNSFVAVVEFGPRVRARAVTAGGESGDPKSPHFTDEARRYVDGNLRDVYFYPDQLAGHTERTYRPGE
ncbi:penicillin acylase family protein [Sphingomonas sp. ASV193]|uniref:penicillin acylase family protein n=1 Tax=Sphingomonas sp. ASV193 TaxID=3144405 RepID=UPI0032E90E3A